MAIPNYAGGVLCYTEIDNTQYVLLGKNAYRGTVDIFSGKRSAEYDGTHCEQTLEESLASKFSEETLEVCATGQRIYDKIMASSGHTASLIRTSRERQPLEYRIFTIFLKTDTSDIQHRTGVRCCPCVPCKFSKLPRSAEHPIESLVWVKLEHLFSAVLRNNLALPNGMQLNRSALDSIRTLVYSSQFKRTLQQTCWSPFDGFPKF